MSELKPCRCGKCGETKDIACFVDGLPWCEDCFDKALEDNRRVEEGEKG